MSVTVLHIASPFAVTRAVAVGETHGSDSNGAPDDRQSGERSAVEAMRYPHDAGLSDPGTPVSASGAVDHGSAWDASTAMSVPTIRSVQAAYASMMDGDSNAVGIVSPGSGDGSPDHRIERG